MQVINFHFTNICNYNCGYCFAKYNNKKSLSLDECKKVVDKVAEFFFEKGIKRGRINLVGGEPLTVKFIDALIDYCYSKSIDVSIVTNGSLLTHDFIDKNKEKLSMIGISVDSLVSTTNKLIGRCTKKNIALDYGNLVDICQYIKSIGIKLKINTVLSKFNINEDFNNLYSAIAPDKIKLFQMCIVKNINDDAIKYKVSKKECLDFFARCNARHVKAKLELEEDMQNSYLMIDQDGMFCVNHNGEYKKYGNVLENRLADLIGGSDFDEMKFEERYKED